MTSTVASTSNGEGMSTVSEFNLLDEPWIAVRDHTDEVELVSLLALFERAPHLRSLAGEMPTQQVAILRLLLAILYRALRDSRNVEAAIDQWAEWWRSDSLPVEMIGRYLETYRHRFDLCDSQEPFFQVAGLAAAKMSGLGKLIGDVPDNLLYFTTRGGNELDFLTLDEAARWLVHCQAFDPSGIKSGAKGDPRVRGGKGYPIGTGFAGTCGLVIIEGQNLKETLLLNLALNVHSDSNDLPVWEREAQYAAPRSRSRVDANGSSAPTPDPNPAGPADVMTWQIRRVRLDIAGGVASNVLICNGDGLKAQNRFDVEPMTAWRFSEPQTKKEGHDVWMPRAHVPERSLWRGLQEMLAPRAKRKGKTPRVIDWVAMLQEDDVLPGDFILRLRAIGMVYGSNNSVVDTVIDDALVLHSALLANGELKGTAIAAATDADAAVGVLANLGTNLARAAGSETSGAASRAREIGYYTLDVPYRRWAEQLTMGVDTTAARRAWQATVYAEVRRLGNELINTSGERAWMGRQMDGGLMDSGRASLLFYGGLRKALDLLPAYDKSQSTPSEEPT